MIWLNTYNMDNYSNIQHMILMGSKSGEHNSSNLGEQDNL